MQHATTAMHSVQAQNYVVIGSHEFEYITNYYLGYHNLGYEQKTDTQWAHDAIITSLLRQNDVATSFWRKNDVIIASCARWVNT